MTRVCGFGFHIPWLGFGQAGVRAAIKYTQPVVADGRPDLIERGLYRDGQTAEVYYRFMTVNSRHKKICFVHALWVFSQSP